MFLVIKPLQGLEGLVDLRPSPATERFDRDGIGCQMVLAPIQIAGTGDGDALGHGIEASLTFKFLLKGFTNRFQQGHIPLAVVDHFLTEIEGHITTNLVSVPTGQFVFLFGHYAIGIVKFQIGYLTHVLLVVGGIEQMRKEPLLQFRQIEGAWKRVNEFEGSALERQDFGPHRQLVHHLSLLLVQLVPSKPFQL